MCRGFPRSYALGTFAVSSRKARKGSWKRQAWKSPWMTEVGSELEVVEELAKFMGSCSAVLENKKSTIIGKLWQ